jgi:hypothetical protein
MEDAVPRLKIASLCAFAIASPLFAQEVEAPRIEAQPRWDADVVRDYLRQQTGEQTVTDAPPTIPETAALQPEPLPVAKPKTQLHGQSIDVVIKKLGTPSLDRRDGRIRLLQFVRPACTLDVIFWRSANQTNLIAHHVESRSARGTPTDLSSCLQKQYAARGFKYEVAQLPAPAPTPAAPQSPAPVMKTEPLAPPSSVTETPAIPPEPIPPQPVPGLSYPLGGAQPPQ